MSTVDPLRVSDGLNHRFFVDYPQQAAQTIERLDRAEVVAAAVRQPVQSLVPVWRHLLPDTAAELLAATPDAFADRLLVELPPPIAARVLWQMPLQERSSRLARLDPSIRDELNRLLNYPPNTAGRLMNPRAQTFRPDTRVAQAIERLRSQKMVTARSLFIVDDHHRLIGKVALQNIAIARPTTPLADLAESVPAAVRPTDPVEEVIRVFETGRMLDLPVIDIDGVFLGVVTHDDLVQSAQEDATADMQAMVGASREERALSPALFAVRRRMPWLQINLLTAFLAAAVVGIFESTIAQVTALAVLLPVVTGQSGNAGAQALAVTMRGLALREITLRQWATVMRKEVVAGFLNGIAIAVTCGLGVFVWSQSLGLVVVICASMILAMVAAGFAGALIPIALTRFGQDPATSSSIILTTVTDVAGFFSFLGIATLLLSFLQAG